MSREVEISKDSASESALIFKYISKLKWGVWAILFYFSLLILPNFIKRYFHITWIGHPILFLLFGGVTGLFLIPIFILALGVLGYKLGKVYEKTAGVSRKILFVIIILSVLFMSLVFSLNLYHNHNVKSNGCYENGRMQSGEGCHAFRAKAENNPRLCSLSRDTVECYAWLANEKNDMTLCTQILEGPPAEYLLSDKDPVIRNAIRYYTARFEFSGTKEVFNAKSDEDKEKALENCYWFYAKQSHNSSACDYIRSQLMIRDMCFRDMGECDKIVGENELNECKEWNKRAASYNIGEIVISES